MKHLLSLILLAVLAAPTLAQEKLTLATPVSKTTTEWVIAYFTVDVETMSIAVVVKDNVGERKEVRYPNAATTQAQTNTLINGLNTADLSVKSLRRRILERLQADGYLGAGALSGGV